MNDQQVAIGSEVHSNDGRSIGTVEHLIIDSNENALSGFVVDKGIFDGGRVVNLEYVSSVSEDVVVLSLSGEEAMRLPGFEQHQFRRFEGGLGAAGVPGSMFPMGGLGGAWVPAIPGAGVMPGTGVRSSYVTGVEADVTSRPRGPLTESEIVLDNGTDVVDVNGDKIGKVDDVIISVDDKVQGFVVEQGFLFHHDVYVPMDWVDAITHEHVRLAVAKEEVERSKR